MITKKTLRLKTSQLIITKKLFKRIIAKYSSALKFKAIYLKNGTSLQPQMFQSLIREQKSIL